MNQMKKKSDKLTLKDMRNVDAAYNRGQKYTMQRLGDGALRLRKRNFSVKDHDTIHADLCAWLSHENFGLRAPGVRENLFRLSDYLSERAPVPPREVLLFLHAYIFALEGLSGQKARGDEKERKERWRPKKKRPRLQFYRRLNECDA